MRFTAVTDLCPIFPNHTTTVSAEAQVATVPFTSESVGEGHPDKLADQVSDAILDHLIDEDPLARGAIEILLAHQLVVIAGEWASRASAPPAEEIARKTLADAGYTSPELGIDAMNCRVLVRMNRQSGDIAMGVDRGGAGDQGIMFGYATDDTPELMPAPIQYAHLMMRELAKARRQGRISWLRPDGKGQVTMAYGPDGRGEIETVVLSAQHDPGMDQGEVRRMLHDEVVARAIPVERRTDDWKCFVNPTGSFVTGGPEGDAGLTGRKLIVDTYGGMARHGGGAFSGKDPTKVDRSAAYAARWAAKNVVAAGLAHRCELQLAYAIGKREPVSVRLSTFGTTRDGLTDQEIGGAVNRVFDFTPSGIIDTLNLRRPLYKPTACYGHFGRDPVAEAESHGARVGDLFPWEMTDRTGDLLEVLG